MINVKSVIHIHRLNGKSYFQGTPKLSVESADNGYGTNRRDRVCVRVERGGKTISMDVDPEDLRQAIANALAKAA